MDPYQQYLQSQEDPRLGINRRIRSSSFPLAGNIDLGPAIEGPASGGTRRTVQVPGSMEDIGNLYQKTKAGLRESVLQPGGVFKNQAGAYRGAAGGKTGALLGAVGTTMEDPVAGLISVVPGVAAGGAANMLTTALTKGMMSGPPPLKAAGMALRYLAPAYVGGAVQQATARGTQSLLGTGSAATPTAGGIQSSVGGLFGLGGPLEDLKVPLPFGGQLTLGKKAQLEKLSEYDRQQRRKDMEMQLQMDERRANLQQRNDLEFARAMGQIQNQNTINQMSAMAPIIADAQRRELAGQQTLLNTQGAIYQRLGRMAGMFQLAERGMSESGALARTMAANSPYNAAILPAPQISFGN